MVSLQKSTLRQPFEKLLIDQSVEYQFSAPELTMIVGQPPIKGDPGFNLTGISYRRRHQRDDNRLLLVPSRIVMATGYCRQQRQNDLSDDLTRFYGIALLCSDEDACIERGLRYCKAKAL